MLNAALDAYILFGNQAELKIAIAAAGRQFLIDHSQNYEYLADKAQEQLLFALGFVPVIGTAVDGYMLYHDVASGDYFAAGIDGAILVVSIVPIVGLLGELITRITKKGSDEVIAEVGGETGDALAKSAEHNIVLVTDSAGNIVPAINGVEMSIHAAIRAKQKNISNDEIAAVLKLEPFEFIQHGELRLGYYDPINNLFVAVGDRIVSVVRPRNANYIENLKQRQ